MKKAGNEKSLESIYKNEKNVFQRGDGTMSFPRIPLCTAVGTRLYPTRKKQKGKCPVHLIGKTLACSVYCLCSVTA